MSEQQAGPHSEKPERALLTAMSMQEHYRSTVVECEGRIDRLRSMLDQSREREA